MLVEGWNVGWDGDWFHNGKQFRFTEPYPDFDLKAVTDYARRKGVRLVGHHETAADLGNYEPQMAAAFDLYESMGVRQIKTGYVADAGDIRRIDANGVELHEWHDGQFTVDHHLRLLQEAAKRKISINSHEPVKDTGLRRTYPNWLSREGARGQEYNAWGSPVNPPEHTAMLPFTRMLAGPMDYTPGVLDLTFEGLDGEHRVKQHDRQGAVAVRRAVQPRADGGRPARELREARRRFPVHQGRADGLGRKRRAGGRGGRLRRDRAQAARVAGLVPRRVDRRKCPLAAARARLPRTERDATSRRSIATARRRTGRRARTISSSRRRDVTAADTLELQLATSGGAAIRFKRTR